MKTIGETLRSIRLKRGLSLEELASISSIKQEYLSALETNDFSSLPSPTAVIGFLGTYATLLGIERQTALSLLRRDYNITPSQISLKSYIPARPSQKILSTRIKIYVSVFSFLLALIAYAIFTYFRINTPPPLTILSPKNGSHLSSPFLVEGTTSTDVRLDINGEPTALNQDGGFTKELLIEKGAHTISISARDRNGLSTLKQVNVVVK